MKAPILILALFVAVGCRSADDQVVGKPPASAAIAEQPVQRAAPPPSKPRVPDPRLSIAGWPFHENTNTFELRWTGGNRAAPLYKAPDPNSPLLGDVRWDDGERILWTDTAVSIYQPRVLRAQTDDWLIEGPIYETGYLTGNEYTEVRLNKGQRIEVWAYGGDGICYLASPGSSQMFTAPCPSAEHFSGLGEGKVMGERYMPAKLTWWIQITGSNLTGWVPVDDRMTLDIIQN